MSTTYPAELRERLVRRMLGPDAISLDALGRETGICPSTLSRWRLRARSLGAMTRPIPPDDPAASAPSREPRRPRDWTPEDRLRAVIATAGLSDAALGEWLRRAGLHTSTLSQWRQAALKGLGAPESGADTTRSSARRVRDLERALLRKDRALAETTALLVLQGKLQALLGEEGGNTDRT